MAEGLSRIHGPEIEPPEPKNGSGRTGRRGLQLLTLGCFVLVLWFVGRSLVASFSQVNWNTLIFRPGGLAAGLVLVLVAYGLGVWVNHGLLARLGQPVSWPQSVVLMTVPPLGKYLPSKVMSVAGYAALAKTYGVRVPVSGAVGLLLMGLGLTGATLVGFLLLLDGSRSFLNPTTSRLLAGAVVVAAVALIHPRLYWAGVNLGLRLLHRHPIAVDLDLATTLGMFIRVMLQNGLYLAGVSLTVLGVMDLSWDQWRVMTGVNCLANVLGFVALFAPAGIGVREGIVLMLLTPVLGPGPAGLITVLTRLSQTVFDLLLAGIGLTVGWLQRRRDLARI